MNDPEREVFLTKLRQQRETVINELTQLDHDFKAHADAERQLQNDAAAQEQRKHSVPSRNAYYVIKRSFQRELWALNGALLHGLPVEEL